MLKPLIARLDPGTFTAFVGGLLATEALHVGLSPAQVVMSDAISEPDGGLDAILEDVPSHGTGLRPATDLVEGRMGFQLKAARRKTPSAFELAKELRKPGPKRLLVNGGTYVLVSSQDLNPQQRSAIEEALVKEAEAVLAEEGVTASPSVRLWDAETLAIMSMIHPAPAMDLGLSDFGAALTLQELLDILHAEQRPFQSDAARDEAIQQIRNRLGTDQSDPLLLQVHGDPGIGKTRTVAHALDIEEARDLVLWINGRDDLNLLITRLARNSMSRGILFVDEVDAHDAADAMERISGLGGRWRLVTVTSRGDSRWMPSSTRNIVLPPMADDAMQELLEGHSGLSSTDARRVAQVASGFPELAFTLADELHADPTLDLVRLARLPQASAILERALKDDDTRRHLAPLALFAGVGFEDELRTQMIEVASAFDLDPAAMEHACESELGRFVSRAGRYRLISPLLVAIWLATDLIERTPGFSDRVATLSQPLQDAFVRQLDVFGPDAPHL
ncbi:MAG: hypothetical protein ACC652_11090, partial [Acidimicrobiales bacterium]